MNNIKIIALFGLSGNGGIHSWAKKLLKTFPSQEVTFIPINNAPLDRKGNNNVISRIRTGIGALYNTIRKAKTAIKSEHPKILHTTTSGDIGSFRDYLIGRICKKNDVKSILHCHYGCISENVNSKGLVGNLTRLAMRQFDQIWVLDSRSYNTLKNFPAFSDKVFLVPNSIEVNKECCVKPTEYRRVAFIGNLIPSKGIYELVQAATKSNVKLDIIGPGTPFIVEKIKELAGDRLNKSIFLHGKLPNKDAVKFMREIDILALPTYFPSEAFPISILEAMANSRMVISCPRAAIPDMLTSLDGSKCGLLVNEKSVDEIVKAIEWCQLHKDESDEMRKKAYNKVLRAYSQDVVYDLYKNLYYKLLQ